MNFCGKDSHQWYVTVTAILGKIHAGGCHGELPPPLASLPRIFELHLYPGPFRPLTTRTNSDLPNHLLREDRKSEMRECVLSLGVLKKVPALLIHSCHNKVSHLWDIS